MSTYIVHPSLRGYSEVEIFDGKEETAREIGIRTLMDRATEEVLFMLDSQEVVAGDAIYRSVILNEDLKPEPTGPWRPFLGSLEGADVMSPRERYVNREGEAMRNPLGLLLYVDGEVVKFSSSLNLDPWTGIPTA